MVPVVLIVLAICAVTFVGIFFHAMRSVDTPMYFGPEVFLTLASTGAG